ncbi:MAG TPA: hypothetical protein VFK05_25805 [Polyangiaceae bacterium]|nr:hypothetical protein [Polyangiaceae bacterium]
MRLPQWVSDFFEWRWAPCFGLTAGSLAFVALALILIPTRFGGEPRALSNLSTYQNPPPQRAIFSSALARSAVESDEPRTDARRVARPAPSPAPQRTESGAPLQRGFSPVIERPEPLPPPAPPPTPTPAAAEQPPPAAASVVVVQPVPGGESREVNVQ